MSHALTFTEIEGQHAELLPARIALSMIDILNIGEGDSNPQHGRPGVNSAHFVEGRVYQYPSGIRD